MTRTAVALRYLALVGALTTIAIACGSSESSEFGDPNAKQDGGGTDPGSSGGLIGSSGGTGDGGSQGPCMPKSCADQGIACGSAGDTCGNAISCASCPPGEVCSGVPAKCGTPACTKKTCSDLGVECGGTGDGCGGALDCGTCEAGICGGGGPSKCGAGGGDGGAGDGGVCVPTKTACAVGDCGPIGDGCGNIIDCAPPAWPACPVGETCGGGGVGSRCGAPPCVKNTCGTKNCGYIPDGCGGSVNCWPVGVPPVCGPGEACGTVTPDTCGPIAGCTGLCQQQATCPGGGTTSIEGYVTSPNGVLPVPNAVVYVPNGVVAAFAPGVQCETCATASGSPLVTTTTDANGHFLLPNMPVSTIGKVVDIPVVVQLGKWRKQLTVQTTACANNLVPKFADASTTVAAGSNALSLGGSITAASNASPIRITTGAAHGLNTGAQVTISGVAGNTAANGTFTITRNNATRFDLNGSTGNGAFTGGGAWRLPNPYAISVASTAGFPANGTISVATSSGVQLITYTGLTATTFTGCTGGRGSLSTGGAVVHRSPWGKNAALPSAQAEGDIPLTAISTGSVDGLECVLRKMGVADSEFTPGTGTGRIRLYQDPGDGSGSGGACAAGCGASCGDTATCPRADVLYCPGGKSGAGACGTGVLGASNEIDKFDAAIFGCVGGESNKGVTARNNVIDYANRGGRVFATHFSYVWLYSTTTPLFASPWAATANVWNPGRASWNQLPTATLAGSMSAIVDTSFPKGVLFAAWLQAPVAPVSASFAPPYPAVNGLYAQPSATSPAILALTEPRKDIEPTAPNLATSGIVAPAQRWIYSTDDNGVACASGATCKSGVCTASKCVGSVVFAPGTDPAAQDAPMHYTFLTPALPAAQCGRVLYSDFHVSTGASTNNVAFPDECDGNPLTAQEKVLAYMLFDLASCVSTSGPVACVPKSCADQNLGCGLAGDGCGGPLDCGPCPAGQTCGGAGVPSQCGAPACTPKTCPAPPAAAWCGKQGDGCGGQIDCGVCEGGTCGGGGVASQCGSGGPACLPASCPTAALGSVCGPVADGCGGLNTCACPPGVNCVNGLCGDPVCVKRTCASAGANCGQVADGCGGVLQCPDCIAPQTCGGGGTPNLCGGVN